MFTRFLTSRMAVGFTATAVGFSVYYRGYYQPQHIIHSSFALQAMQELYETNHMKNRENNCNRIGIIVFDGVCNICNGGIKFVDRFEKMNNDRLYVAWAQNEETTKPLLRKLDISDQSIMDRFAFIEYDAIHGDIRLYRASSAALQCATYLKFPLNLMIVGIIIPESFRDFVYDAVAKSRYQLFGKTDKCQIDEARRIISRFIHKID